MPIFIFALIVTIFLLQHKNFRSIPEQTSLHNAPRGLCNFHRGDCAAVSWVQSNDSGAFSGESEKLQVRKDGYRGAQIQTHKGNFLGRLVERRIFSFFNYYLSSMSGNYSFHKSTLSSGKPVKKSNRKSGSKEMSQGGRVEEELGRAKRDRHEASLNSSKNDRMEGTQLAKESRNVRGDRPRRKSSQSSTTDAAPELTEKEIEERILLEEDQPLFGFPIKQLTPTNSDDLAGFSLDDTIIPPPRNLEEASAYVLNKMNDFEMIDVENVRGHEHYTNSPTLANLPPIPKITATTTTESSSVISPSTAQQSTLKSEFSLDFSLLSLLNPELLF